MLDLFPAVCQRRCKSKQASESAQGYEGRAVHGALLSNIMTLVSRSSPSAMWL